MEPLPQSHAPFPVRFISEGNWKTTETQKSKFPPSIFKIPSTLLSNEISIDWLVKKLKLI